MLGVEGGREPEDLDDLADERRLDERRARGGVSYTEDVRSFHIMFTNAYASL